MFRTRDVAMIAIMLSAAAFTYKTKHDAEALRKRIHTLESQIQAEKDAIDVLKADWSLLVQPNRLQDLAETHEAELGLRLVEPQQIITMQELRNIPFRPAPDIVAQEDKDPTVTGGVER
ncbi:hypothetical protein G5B41_12985 [bacterium SGD-2]|nr:hypothetical protein [bacterium SGD-2]